MMKIIKAENAGFCFGVRRADRLIREKIDRDGGRGVYTLGKLIHNDGYNSALYARGVREITADDLPRLADEACAESPVCVFVRAHGMTEDTEELLSRAVASNRFFSYVDCTCPYVKKIHGIVSSIPGTGPDGLPNLLVFFGDEIHPETVGTMSRCRGRSIVVHDCASLEEAYAEGLLPPDGSARVYCAAQTTQNLAEWEKIRNFLKKLYTNPVFFDTICNVTENRQKEARRLAARCDFTVVIGGSDSSNTAKLFAVCSEVCGRTVRVSGASELEGVIPCDCVNAGIVAGASTPDDIIEEVYSKMSEESKAENVSFEEMLDSACKTISSGDTVTGTVIAVNDQEIKLDLGCKVTGILTADQASDDASLKLSSEFKVGDEIDVFVIKVSDVDGTATVSKKRADLNRNWFMIVDAKEKGETLEGVVSDAVKGGVVIRALGARIFVPASQTTVPKDGELSSLVGKTVKFKIIEIKNQGKGAVGSIRAAAREERRALEKEFWENIEVGKYYDGVVRGMTDYGAFIDLGGVDGMIHKKNLSWRPIHKPSDILQIGDHLRVFVRSYNPEKKQISLGYITPETNPWVLFKAKFSEGDVIDVVISNIMTYGAFAHITDDVDGLIHVSQIAEGKVANPADYLTPGQTVTVRITKIDDENQRVSLSIKAVSEQGSVAVDEGDDLPADDSEGKAED
ncbi:MAG: 4-hydroxy-3-methylbut-2-enyl diphosphate reductase [Clostridia bacterium]|nr:4-hydroxy-3-methylbut-2-enyl diphosphate reductase [Clostridia bacterium]